MLKARKTGRGFVRIAFKDEYGEQCSIKESSIMVDEGVIWFGVDDPRPQVLASTVIDGGTGWVEWPLPDGAIIHSRMHLTQSQVKALLPALQHFVETGLLPD